MKKPGLIAVLVILGLPTSCVVAEWRAESQAKAFCAKFAVGSAFKRLLEKRGPVATRSNPGPQAKWQLCILGFRPFHVTFVISGMPRE